MVAAVEDADSDVKSVPIVSVLVVDLVSVSESTVAEDVEIVVWLDIEVDLFEV